jgi:hypothetical protein
MSDLPDARITSRDNFRRRANPRSSRQMSASASLVAMVQGGGKIVVMESDHVAERDRQPCSFDVPALG